MNIEKPTPEEIEKVEEIMTDESMREERRMSEERVNSEVTNEAINERVDAIVEKYGLDRTTSVKLGNFLNQKLVFDSERRRIQSSVNPDARQEEEDDLYGASSMLAHEIMEWANANDLTYVPSDF